MTRKRWVYGGIALLFVIGLLFHIALITLPILLGAVVVMVVRIARSLFQDILGPDLTKPIGLFVLRLLIPAGIALGLFLWANHYAEEIAPQEQMAQIFGSSRQDDSLKVYQTIILVLRTVGSLAIGIALLRLYHLYRRLEAGQITMTSVLQQIQTRTQPSVVVPVAPSAEDIEKRLNALKRMKDEGIISEAEYGAKRTELINRM